MKKTNKALPLVLASALAATPFVAVPHAQAISSLEISADDDGAGEDSKYDIEFRLDKALDSGDYIYVEFDSDYTVSKSIGTSDIKADFDIKSVKVSGREIQIRIDEDLGKGDDVSFTIKDGITNPDDKGSYSVDVKTTSENAKSKKVTIKGSSSSSSSSSKGDYSVTLGSKASGDTTSIKLGEISLKKSVKLETNETITVIFPSSSMLPSKIDSDDVKVNGSVAKEVKVKSDEVTIKVPSGANKDSYINLEFTKSAGIENPKTGDYTIKVKYDGSTYESKKFEVTKSGSGSSSTSSDAFTVSLSDPSAGARSSYTFDADFGNKKLMSDEDLILEFPSADMIPGILTYSDFTLNGKTAKRASASGNKVYITAPSGFSSSSEVKVVVSFGAWISNPKTAGTYTLKASIEGKTLESKSFTINGSAVNPTPTNPTNPTNPTTPTPNVVNNSTATIALTSNALGKPTGVNIAIKGMGIGLVKQRDFVELVFPAGYKVPAYIAPANVSVNGVGANYVAVRGQNVLIYPAQDIPAATAANITITAAANIVNPTVKNAYSISVFTSEEKGLLFARAVGVGMPSPAQPAPQPTTPTPAPQPSVTVPTNAALFKVNTANFTLHGKTYPLQVAPYIAGGNTTMVPAQFFKEALALTTQWNNQSVAIISGTKAIKFTVGSNKAKIGNQEITLPTAVVLNNGMPMIPVRFVTDNLGYQVGWDAKTSSVFVYK
ncbi:copper amine oxidase N-terminal domain-containing protein [Brevibacillus reuszeri]|uniref:copper amine oxidase N-terminal domain-containing protein n=1 Tax=Brevibacillus reuszeri TaxID=54915 RepID=UPI00289CA0A5|nr:copper amine oxidase N-terminal domain-containing protein [Brevibacillus reuszeri]